LRPRALFPRTSAGTRMGWCVHGQPKIKRGVRGPRPGFALFCG
jgi:hypothetical protein